MAGHYGVRGALVVHPVAVDNACVTEHAVIRGRLMVPVRDRAMRWRNVSQNPVTVSCIRDTQL